MEDYVNHLAKLNQSQYKPDILILREKKLSEEEYGELLEQVVEKLSGREMELIPHMYVSAAEQLGIGKIHLPFSMWKEQNGIEYVKKMNVIGTSIHSVEEAIAAEQMGAAYITAGHIFTTDCKPDLEPRGVEFLEKVCQSVKIPVYAIGGIHPGNLEEIRNSGAAGACMMSEYMKDSQ